MTRRGQEADEEASEARWLYVKRDLGRRREDDGGEDMLRYAR